MSIKSCLAVMSAAVLLFTGSCKDEGNPTQMSSNKKVYGVFSLFIDQVLNKTSLSGKLYNGPIPIPVWDTIMTVGDCNLIIPKQKTCQGCGAGSVCVDNNNCQPEPDTVTAGDVIITGMTNRAGEKSSMVKATNGTYQPTLDDRPANPPCTEGATMTLSASGSGSAAAFTLTTKTISKLEISADTIAMDPGKPINLKWTAASNPDDSKIKVVIDVSYHGGTRGKVECLTRDDGELEIPAVLLDSLKTFGLSGHPKMEIYRQSIGTDPGTGVEFKIEAFVQLWLKIPGLVSCSCTPNGLPCDQCPEGQTCGGDQRCWEIEE